MAASMTEPSYSISIFTLRSTRSTQPVLQILLIPGARLEPPRRSTTALGQALTPATCRYRTTVSRDGTISRLVSAQRSGRRLPKQLHGESAGTGPRQVVGVVANSVLHFGVA